MVYIVIYGFPKTSQRKLAKCCEEVCAVPGHVSGVEVPSCFVAVFFPADQFKGGLGNELFACVYGLDTACHPKPNKEQKDNLRRSIATVLHRHKPSNCRFIQVQTCQTHPDECYAMSTV